MTVASENITTTTATALTTDSMVAAVPGQVSVDLEDETIILELDSGIYYGLNQTGAFIWQQLQAATSVGAICQALLEQYDVGPEQAVQSVLNLLHELLAYQLIEQLDEQHTPKHEQKHDGKHSALVAEAV